MLNKIILIGRISTDLELKETSNGNPVVKFNLAVNRMKDGTDFIPVQVYGKMAENLVKYQNKGSQIAIEGSMRVDNYEGNDGNKKYITYVLAQNVHFLDKKNTSETNNEPVVETVEEDDDPFANFGLQTEEEFELPFEE